ncbi:acetyltransferase [Winogradskyella sp. PG-2]|uniref:acetyltransferase n=1 Tax=Winogradskyella sp. PG-2 TaxID=754409 RepID=UPI0004586619|nr:acetyltransferase [Winogradskyella sp. PG-2]BAO77619.1 4-amino-6-deoxy-N-Acetyl-D-hexosaminyl-(Lipid carrier) acetyltrasferase [Winogradskyella sp. PG-2]
MKNILIYGASGHAKMIVDIIHKNNRYKIIGFLDSFKPNNEDIYGYKIIGNLDDLTALIKLHNIEGIIIAIGDNFTRQNAFNKISKIAPQIEFVAVIHPTAVLANDIIIPKGTVIMPNAVVNANAKIGEFCILNTKSSLGHDSKMANFSSLASGAIISGNVKIGVCSAICISASIIQNITIGDHTVIGAASLVLKSIGDYKLAFGVPINIIKERNADSKYLG